MKRVLFIAGPTAGGKSALSLRIAKERDGIIINADSMQVYRDLSVITACPTEAEMSAAPHRLYRFLDGATVCSVSLWMDHAMTEITAAWQQDRLPILVGGTGMYFKMLLEGIARIPDIPDPVRASVRRECEEFGSAHLHKELLAVDPVTAQRLPPGDSQRICRAVEVFRTTQRPLSDWQQENEPGPLDSANKAGLVDKYVLLPERSLLYERCNMRFENMLEEGGLAEVEALMGRNLDESLPVMRALGVPSLIGYLKGECSLADAGEDAKMQTRRFAKRQMTWFRNQFKDWEKLDAQYSESHLTKIIHKIIK